jgi:hypothetical protein
MFRGPVVGPIAKYIKIAPGKEEYAELAELAIPRNMIDRFLVTCEQDRELVNNIRQKAGCRQECGLIVVKEARRYNNVPPPPADGIETVESVLMVTDDLVYNCLGKPCLLSSN